MKRLAGYGGWIKGVAIVLAFVVVALALAAWSSTSAVADSGLQEQVDALASENEALRLRLVTMESDLDNLASAALLGDDIETVSVTVAALGDDVATLAQHLGEEVSNLDGQVAGAVRRMGEIERVAADQVVAIDGAYAAADAAYDRAMTDATNVIASQIYGDLSSLQRCVNSNLTEIADKWNKVASSRDMFGFNRLRLTYC